MSILAHRIQAALQRSAYRWLNDTCNIVNDVINSDQYGAQKVTEVPYKISVPCRVILASNPAGTTAGLVGQQITLTNIYKIAVPSGTGITINHKIIVGGHKYSVIANVTELTDEVFETAIIERQE